MFSDSSYNIFEKKSFFKIWKNRSVFLTSQAFAELQAKVIDTTQRVKIAEAQVDALKRTIMHAKLTDQEVGSLPSDTRTYEPLGRM